MWRHAARRLEAAGIAGAGLDARLLAGAAFGLDTLSMITGEHSIADADSLARFEALLERRLGGEPVARILGYREFHGLQFALSPATLVPRPETEMLVDLAIATLGGAEAPLIADLGTGSGCIAIAVLKALPRASAIATDLSAEALDVARGNAERHGVADRLALRQGLWFAALPNGGRYDCILSNPPYIWSTTIPLLAPEVRDFDPGLALDGGLDGLDAYHVLAAGALGHLKPGGLLAVEIGAGQGEAVSALFADAGLDDIGIQHDLAGHDRVVMGRGK